MKRLVILAVLLAGCASQPKVERFEPDATDTVVIVREDARFDPADAVVVVARTIPETVDTTELATPLTMMSASGIEEPAEPTRKRLKKD